MLGTDRIVTHFGEILDYYFVSTVSGTDSPRHVISCFNIMLDNVINLLDNIKIYEEI